MVKLKEIPRTATFAWSPDVVDPLLVTGTVAGAVDANFSSTTQLELWDLSLLDRSNEGFQVSPKVSVDTDARFYDIAWGSVSPEKPKGIIAGALESGVLQLWDPKALLSGSKSPIESGSNHTGAIKSIKFNPVQSQLLASAGSKGEILVWDINKFASPFAPGTPSSRLDEIECVAWNNTVAHILATGGNTGFTSVWDLKNKREVLHLHYSAQGTRNPVSSIAWHPTNSTKLMTASEDDGSPVILVWDLRNANAPEKILTGHDKGVLSLDWCKQDSGLLLSSGKDNRTLLWNPETGKNLGEYPIAANWGFETKFNPLLPDIFASASFDGKIVVQTLQDTSDETATAAATSAATKSNSDDFWSSPSHVDTQHPTFNVKQAPKWLANPVSVSFGFGGKIVSVTSDGSSTGSKISISNFVADQSFTSETVKFAEALKSENFGDVAKERIIKASNDSDKYDWEILSFLVDAEGTKDKLISLVNSNVKHVKEDEKKEVNEIKNDDSKSAPSDNPFAAGGEDFLSNLSISAKTDIPAPALKGTFNLLASEESSIDHKITKDLLSGNVEDAVNLCLEENRISDAFAIASIGSDAIRLKVQNSYLTKNADKYSFARLLSSLISNDLTDLVENAGVDQWKGIITSLFTYAKDDSIFVKLATKLGDRLADARSSEKGKPSTDLRNSAIFCYVAASNLQRASSLWLGEISELESNLLKSSASDANTPYSAHVKALHSFIEKVTFFRKVSKSSEFPKENADPLYDAYREYANIVASQGHLDLAELYLNLLPSQYPGLSLEKERVSKANKKETSAASKAVSTPASTSASPLKPKTGTASNIYNQPASIYAPTQAYGAYQPLATQQPQSQPRAPANGSYAPINQYQPAGFIQNPYQYNGTPAAVHGPGGSGPIPGVPISSNTGTAPPPPPPPSKKEAGGWNDLPTSALSASSSRKPTPGPNVINPYNTQAVANVTALASPPIGGRVTPNQVVLPPPPPPPPGPAGAVHRPSQSGRTQSVSSQGAAAPFGGPAATPSAPNPYAPIPSESSQGGQTPYGQSYGQTGGGYFDSQKPPATVRSPPPVNPYAPSAGQSGHSGHHQQASGSGNPYLPSQPINAHPPSIRSPPVGQPGGQIGLGGSPFAPPPPVVATTSLQYQPSPGSVVSPTNTTVPPPAAPEPVPVAKKYPAGDRSHIPVESRPIYEVLNAKITKVQPQIPENYKRQAHDAQKRLNILFDHLNNEDLLSSETINDLLVLAQAIEAKDYLTAHDLQVSILTSRSEECGQWMVGVKRLIEMLRALDL